MATLVLILAVVVAPFVSRGAAYGAAPAKKLVIAYAAMNARVCPLWAPRERGFFAKYGFDAETLFVRGAPTLVAAMASNEIEIGYTGGTAVIGSVASGSDLKVLSALTNRVTYDLVTRPGIKSPEDLRGKKFGVQSIDATVLDGVQSRPLHARGFPILAELDKTRLPILSSSIVAREPYIQKNPQVVENVMRAIIEGAASCLSPREKPTTLKILQKYLRVS